MIRRLIYILLALFAAYLCYDIYKLVRLRFQIDEAPAPYVFGPENADLTVVEFLDYGCKFCREIHPAIMQAVERDGHVRYIPRPLVVQGDNSAMAAVLVYAAGEQGKFFEMHNALMENYRAVNPGVIADLAARTGADAEKLQESMSAGAGMETIERNTRLFGWIGGQAIPLFVIGKNMIYVPEGRMPDAGDFLRMFAAARGRKG